LVGGVVVHVYCVKFPLTVPMHGMSPAAPIIVCTQVWVVPPSTNCVRHVAPPPVLGAGAQSLSSTHAWPGCLVPPVVPPLLPKTMLHAVETELPPKVEQKLGFVDACCTAWMQA
jgi:hypothetical protein